MLDGLDCFQYKQTVYKQAYGTKYRWGTIVYYLLCIIRIC